MRWLLAFVFLLGTPFLVTAQSGVGFSVESTLSITSEPEYPAPGETVTLTLDDYSGGAYGAEIAWYRNETPIADSTNARSVTIITGAIGESDVVKAVLTTNGVSRTLTKTITPRYLDIIIEPETHVPGFFKGRALPSVGSTVRLTALLSDESGIKTKGLVYLWRVNQTILEGGPLRDRNTVSFTLPQDSYTFVTLQVSTPTGAILAKRSTVITATAPQVHFYEVNALYGVEARSLTKSFAMIGDSATLVAEPYYLDSNTFNYPGVLTWHINDQPVYGGNNPYSLTLQKTGYPGAATLDFHVRSTEILLQGGKRQLNITI